MRETTPKPDTICALATPAGTGSIAVVRISGPDTFAVLDRTFVGPKPSRQPSHTVRLGWLADHKGQRIDQVMLTVFRRPRSYTGEHMAEVSCHGGTLVADMITETLAGLGCRRAEPGEFARRAVAAGKLTLSQAEAVLDLIHARSPAALRSALERYQGNLSGTVRELAGELRDICVLAEHHIAFDETDSTRPKGLSARTHRVMRRLDSTIRRAERSLRLHCGARVAIIGRTNVGKSSLFNRLLEQERAMVTSEPGTTRDRIEAAILLNGIPVTLTDTAGLLLRPGNAIEKLAAGEAGKALTQADLILAVFDGAAPAGKADRNVLDLVSGSGRPVIYVVNKTDKPRWREPGFLNGHPRVKISALTGENCGRLRASITRRLRSQTAGITACARHVELLRECREALNRSICAPDADTAAVELKSALASVNRVDNPGPNSEILDLVFSRFCIGK